MIKKMINGQPTTVANQFDQTALNGKADKTVPASAGNLATLDTTGNLGDSGKKVNDFILASREIIAVRETSPATAAHAVDTYIYYDNRVYQVIGAIAQGDALVVDTNIELPTLADGTMIYVPDSIGGGNS